jgi:chromate transporter
VLLDVLLEFLRFGILSIGGGLAMLSEMKRVLVIERQWLTAQVFVDGWSLGQFVPGPNMLAMAFYGYRIQGILGAAAAWLGMFMPGVILSIIAAKTWQRVRHTPIAKAFRAAILPIGFGFGAGGVYTLARASITDAIQIVLAIGLLFLLIRLRFNPIITVFLGGAIGILLKFLN